MLVGQTCFIWQYQQFRLRATPRSLQMVDRSINGEVKCHAHRVSAAKGYEWLDRAIEFSLSQVCRHEENCLDSAEEGRLSRLVCALHYVETGLEVSRQVCDPTEWVEVDLPENHCLAFPMSS